jgi:type II restriction enzyme
MHIHKIKTNSHTKGDVRLIFMLSSSNLINDEEFSIKSGMGSDPSLLNAAKTTNFTYLLKNNISEYQNINSIDSHSKIRDRLQRIISKADIEYSYNDSFIFENNLRMLDSFLPEIVSRILLKFFLTGQRKISKLVSMIDTKFERINLSTAQIEFKIKKLLNAIALGMVPGIEWDGKKIGGGCLFIKRTGELVGYTLYNEDIFNELLFNLSYLDTASTSRHNFGSIYKNKNNKQEFKLNFYLRLKI